MTFGHIAVLGLGKVGTLAATLLHESGFKVTGIDTQTPRPSISFDFLKCDLSSISELRSALSDFEEYARALR